LSLFWIISLGKDSIYFFLVWGVLCLAGFKFLKLDTNANSKYEDFIIKMSFIPFIVILMAFVIVIFLIVDAIMIPISSIFKFKYDKKVKWVKKSKKEVQLG